MPCIICNESIHILRGQEEWVSYGSLGLVHTKCYERLTGKFNLEVKS